MLSRKSIILLINQWERGGAQRIASTLSAGLSEYLNVINVAYKGNIDLPYSGRFVMLPNKQKNGKMLYFYRRFKAFKELVEEVDPLAVFSFVENPNCLNIITRLSLSKSNLRFKSIISVHSAKSIDANISERIIIKAFYNKADAIITVSNGIKNDLISNFGIDPSKVVTIYNPIDIGEIKEKACQKRNIPEEHEKFLKRKPVISTCGRLVNSKNIPLLLKSFSILFKGKGGGLLIIGDGEEKESIKELVKKLGITEQVLITGWTDNPYQYMKQSDVFVLSSNWEGLPTVLLEAMALGIPVISTDCPYGPKEIIGYNEYGLLIPMNDVYSLVNALRQMLDSDSRKDHYKRMSISRAGDFSKEVIIKKYLRLFEDITGDVLIN